MPDAVTFHQDLGNASFGIDPASLQQEEEIQEAEPAAEETLETDIVEITLTETEGESEAETPPPESAPATYGPETFTNKFQFAIENGMLDPGKRFNPLKVRFQTGAVETYQARQSLGNQVMQAFGQGSPYTALFNIQYQDASPNPSGASSNVDAKTQQQRIADQNLQLLNTL